MPKNAVIQWGFIGCGEVTEKKSGPAFSLVPGSCVKAVMSRNPERARSYAERHGIPKWYTESMKEILYLPPRAKCVACAIRAYKTAWIKKHCPEAFS